MCHALIRLSDHTQIFVSWHFQNLKRRKFPHWSKLLLRTEHFERIYSLFSFCSVNQGFGVAHLLAVTTQGYLSIRRFLCRGGALGGQQSPQRVEQGLEGQSPGNLYKCGVWDVGCQAWLLVSGPGSGGLGQPSGFYLPLTRPSILHH